MTPDPFAAHRGSPQCRPTGLAAKAPVLAHRHSPSMDALVLALSFALLTFADVGHAQSTDSSAEMIPYREGAPRFVPRQAAHRTLGLVRPYPIPESTPVGFGPTIDRLTIKAGVFDLQSCSYSIPDQRFGDRLSETWAFWRSPAPAITPREVVSIPETYSGGFLVDAEVKACPRTLGEARAIAMRPARE